MDATEGKFYQDQFRANLDKFFALREMVQEAITEMREAEADMMTAKRKQLEAEQKDD